MNLYEQLAEQILSSMDAHRHMPPEPVSTAIRGEMAVLRRLSRESEGMSAGALAQDLSMTTSRIAAVLNSLEKKELIIRRPDEKDRRRVFVVLTHKGISTCLARRDEAKSHLTSLLHHLGEEDAVLFVRLMHKLLDYQCEPPSCKEV